MTTHLTPAELTDALDDRLAADRSAHLDECTQCGDELRALVRAVGTVREDGDVPEPSPFFWEQLGNRVRLATANVPMTPEPWWRLQWKPALAFGLPLILIVFVASRLVSLERPPVAVDPTGDVAVASQPETDESWQSVELIASGLSADDVRRVVAPASASPLIEDLSPRERAAFVELLRVEWESAQ
jgi:hypothetical protein